MTPTKPPTAQEEIKKVLDEFAQNLGSDNWETHINNLKPFADEYGNGLLPKGAEAIAELSYKKAIAKAVEEIWRRMGKYDAKLRNEKDAMLRYGLIMKINELANLKSTLEALKK